MILEATIIPVLWVLLSLLSIIRLLKSQAHTLQNTQAVHQYDYGTSQGYSAIPLHNQGDHRTIAQPDFGSARNQSFANSQWDGSRYNQGSTWATEQEKQTRRSKIVVGGIVKIIDRAWS